MVEERYFIILIAQKDHPEAIGTISFCGTDSIILESSEGIEDVKRKVFESDKNKIAIISQTTYSVSKFLELVEELKKVFIEYEV